MSYNQPHNPRHYFGTRQQGSRLQGGHSDDATNYDAPPYEPSIYEREAWQNQAWHSEGRPDESYRRDQGGRYDQDFRHNQDFRHDQDFRHNQDYRSSQREFMGSEYELGGGSREDWQQPRYSQQDAGFQGWLDRGFRGEHQGHRGAQQSFRGLGPKGYERSDERIKEDLCERLTHDHFVDASEVTVTVKAGVVTLEGTIGDRNQKYRAEYLADNISGAKDVQNRLNVARSSQQSAEGTSAGGADFGRGTQSSDLSTTSTPNVTRQ